MRTLCIRKSPRQSTFSYYDVTMTPALNGAMLVQRTYVRTLLCPGLKGSSDRRPSVRNFRSAYMQSAISDIYPNLDKLHLSVLHTSGLSDIACRSLGFGFFESFAFTELCCRRGISHKHRFLFFSFCFCYF